MDLDFSEDQKLLRDQLRRFMEAECPSAAVRKILDGQALFDRNVYQGLAELGVLGAAIPEEFGGAGLSHLELCVLAEELGRASAPVPVSSSIYLAAEFIRLGGTESQKHNWLPRFASGTHIGALAYVEGEGAMRPERIKSVVAAGRLHGRKTIVNDGDVADLAIVAARSADGSGGGDVALFLVGLDAPGVTRRTLSTIDPTRGSASLDFDDVPCELLGDGADHPAVLAGVLDQAAILMAFEQIGGADRALEMARDYALQRIAFGRPIGSFQAIKHMLADMFVAASLARSNCYYAACALVSDAADLPAAAATARISATKAFMQCSKNNIHIHGGMGFTWEFDCQLYYRRACAQALALGPLSTWEERLIANMRRGAIPADQGEFA